MRPYHEADSSSYTGRGNYIIHLAEELCRRVEPRFLAVAGASGSGKSSLINAGLLPRLRAGTLRPETKSWVYVTLRPGANAWSNLRAAVAGVPALLPFIGLPPTEPDKWLHEVASAALGTQHGAPRLVLIVDQFEELVTSRPPGTSEGDKQRRAEYVARIWKPFARNLSHAASDPSGPVSVILTIRSDFLGQIVDDEDFGPLLAEARRRCFVLPLSEGEVRSAVERPAVARGLSFDAALVESVVQDYLLDPAGALPFLQEALLRVWEKGGGKGLSLADYRGIGGLRGAVNAHAEETLDKLKAESPIQAELMLPLFVYLTRLADDGGSDTKRRRPVAELPGGEPSRELALDLAASDCRLLVFGDAGNTTAEVSAHDTSKTSAMPQPAAPSSASVEIAHESLLGGWQNLKLALGKNRSERLHLRRLETMARAWEEEEPDIRPELLRGGALRGAEQVYTKLQAEVPRMVERYLLASRNANRWRMLRNVFSLILVCAVAVAVVAWMWVGAKDARQTKERQRLLTDLQKIVAAPRFDAPSAEEHARRIVKIEPENSYAWSIYGRALLGQGLYPELESVLADWEKNVRPRAAKIDDLRGDAKARMGKTDEAIGYWTAYARAPNLDREEQKQAWRKLADAYVRQQQWVKVLECLNDWIKKEDSLEARARRATAYHHLQQWEEMNSDIRWAEQNHPKASETMDLLPLKMKGPARDADEKIRLEPRNPNGYSERALALAREGKLEAAIDSMEIARKLDADSPRLKIEQAFLQWQKDGAIVEELRVANGKWTREPKQLPAAVESLRKQLVPLRAAEEVMRAGTRSLEQFLVRGELLTRLGQHRLAVEDFTAAIDLDPSSAATYQRRSGSYRALGDGAAADADSRKAAQLKPTPTTPP